MQEARLTPSKGVDADICISLNGLGNTHVAFLYVIDRIFHHFGGKCTSVAPAAPGASRAPSAAFTRAIALQRGKRAVPEGTLPPAWRRTFGCRCCCGCCWGGALLGADAAGGWNGAGGGNDCVTAKTTAIPHSGSDLAYGDGGEVGGKFSDVPPSPAALLGLLVATAGLARRFLRL